MSVAETLQSDAEVFDVLAFIKAASDECSSPDPRMVAEKIVTSLPDWALRDVLRWALPYRLRTVLGGQPVRTARRDSQTFHPPEPAVGESKFTGIGKVYLNFLNASIFTGSEWKFAGDCTPEDADAIYGARLDLAKATAVEGKRWHMFAEAMRKANAKTLADLPEVTVLEVLRWQP